MAKGTRVSDVNFSVPEGADPMGIGIPDLGKSSYDPIATIKQGWDNYAQNSAIKDSQRREDWKAQKKALPTFEAVNANVAGILNKKAMQLGEFADRKYKSGEFFPFATTGQVDDKTGKKKKAWEEMQRLESDLSKEGEAYNALLPAYKEALKIRNNPSLRDELDLEYTDQQMKDFATGDLSKMAEVAPNLVGYKPTPVQMMEEVTKRMESYYNPDELIQLKKAWDPDLQKFVITEGMNIDLNKAKAAMPKIYEDLSYEKNPFTNDVKRRYKNASESEKIDKETGVVMDNKDWFSNRFFPFLDQRIKTTRVSKATPAAGSDKPKFDWSNMLGNITRDEKGAWKLPEDGMTEIANKGEGTASAVNRKYKVSATIDFSAISDKIFPMTTSN
ncbi:MAG: hypothetical protein IMZ64_04185, partial [Bacteroidetes bacterium]|nr:hypothetical protein [Bacteroidota bacterium]